MQPKDPIEELHSTELYHHLHSLNEDYARRITTFVREVAPLMALVVNHFPYYTRHDAHHGYQVVTRMKQCLVENCFDSGKPEALSAQEIFLLIAAAYAHDLGMTVFPEEREAIAKRLDLTLDANWPTNEVLQQYLRKNHSSRGGEYINENAEKLGVPRNLITALDRLMKSHNYPLATLEQELQQPFAAGHKEIDLAQLALIVCVADYIEFSDTRVIDGVFDRIAEDGSQAARISYNENMKHVCISDSLSVNSDGSITVSGTFNEAPVLALAHLTFDDMEKWIQAYSDIDHRCKYRRLRVRGEPFRRNLEFRGGNFHRIGVRLDKRSVIDLISSNAIWRNNGGFALREMIQNSLEACRYRAHHSSPADKYLPEIRVEFDREHHLVIVHDNGCGMSERTVLNNLLTVGSSRSKEPSYADTDYAPIARFGIGFWSVFTISDSAVVSTAAFESYRGKPAEAVRAKGFTFDVHLSELKDFTVFSPIERPCGTTITLKIKPDIIVDDLYTKLKSEILCSEVPLTLVLDGNEQTIGKDVPEVTETELFKARRDVAKSLEVKFYQYRGAKGQTQLSFGLAYRMESGRATFTVEPGISMIKLTGGYHVPRTAVCGFVVASSAVPYCIDLQRIGLSYINSLTPEGFEFSIDRQQLGKNASSQQLLNVASQIFHEGYRAFLASTDSYHPSAIYELRKEAALLGGDAYDDFSGDELRAASAFPDLFCTKLIPVSPTTSFDTARENAQYVNLDDVSKIGGRIFCLQAFRASDQYGFGWRLGSEESFRHSYEVVQKFAESSPTEPTYIMQPDRMFSMLFDNDSTATATAIPALLKLDVCILSVCPKNVNYSGPARDVVENIQGEWTGTIYWRDFQTPDNCPYLFLGRYRVLIKPNTRLHAHFKSLVDAKKFVSLASDINLLKEHEAGYMPAAMEGLL